MPKTILLADDSVTIQKVVELTFMEEDYTVTAVGTGGEALERLREMVPDLVIADVHMPGPDGYEVCRQVKQSSPETPVLLLVGTFEAFDPSDVGRAGGDGYLKKPFDSQELIRTVERLLKGASQGTPADVEPPEKSAASAVAAPFDPGPPPIDSEVAALWPGETEDKEAEPEPAAPAAEVAPAAEEPAAAEPEAAPEVEEIAAPEPPVAAEEPEAAPGPPPAEEAPGAALSDEDVDRVARRLVEILGDSAVREVAWEVVPDLAEVVIKERLRELESQLD